MLPREEDLTFLLQLLAEEMERREGTSFGYAKEPHIARLQAWASIARQVKREAEAKR